MGIMSYFVRPQVGQEIRSGPLRRMPAACKMFLAATISSDRVCRQAHPQGVADPDAQQAADAPMADLMTPISGVPASVTPRWSG